MATFRAITRAMDTAKAIAENDKLEPAQRTVLAQQVLQAASTPQQMWDNWAQRFVAVGLGMIGFGLMIFIGVAMLKGNKIDSAVPTALSGAIGGLAGMFTSKLGSSGGGNGGGGNDGGGGGAQPSTGTTTKRPPARG